MGTTIQMLRGIVTSDVRGFLEGAGKVVSATRDIRTQWMTTANAIGSAAARITAAISGIGVYAAKSFADFEDTMVEVGAITRTLGTRDFKLLEEAALDMGEKTRYSATEAAQALKQLSLAGLGAQQSIAALPPTLQLAAAANISIGQSAGISAKTMKAYGMEAGQLAHVNDVLVSTFTRANTDLNMLSEGMKHVAPVAKVLNVSLEDMTATLAKMADAGFQGEMGGTALRNILSRLSGAMPDAMGKLSRLGITTLDTTGKMRPFLDILQEIEDKGLSAGQVLEIFGQRGGPQLLALLEQGAGAIKKFSAETSKAGGVAERMMKARMSTLKGQWDELASIWNSTFIDLGSQITPILEKLINETEGWIRANKAEVITSMKLAVEGIIRTLRDMLGWVNENRKELWGFAESMAGVIRQVADFLARYPELVAAIVAFKAMGFLGINNALLQTVGLLSSVQSYLRQTILEWAAYGRAASAAAGASGIAGGASAAVGVAGTAGATAATTGFTAALVTATAKMGLIGVIVAEIGVVLWQLREIFFAVSNQQAKNEQALKKTQEAGAAQVKKVQDERIQKAMAVREQRKEVEGKDPGAGSTIDILKDMLGASDAEVAKAKTAHNENLRKKAAADAVIEANKDDEADSLQKRLEKSQIRKRARKDLELAEAALEPSQNSVTNHEKFSKDLRENIAEQSQIGFNEVRDNVKDPDIRRNATKERAEIQARRNAGEITQEQADLRLKKLEGLPDFTGRMESLVKQFKAGGVSVDEFQAKVAELSGQMKKAGEDAEGSRQFQALAKTKRRMLEGVGPDGLPLAGGKSEGIQSRVVDELQSTLRQLNNVDKQWASLIAQHAEVKMRAVEEMRRELGATIEVLAAEKEVTAQLGALNTEAREAISATIAGRLTDKQKEQRLNRRKEAASGYDDFSEQITEMVNTAGGVAGGGLQNIGADAIAQLAEGVEGATAELKSKFIDDFKSLQAAGPQKFMEGIEGLTLQFVEDANKLKEAAEKLKKNGEDLDAALAEMASPGGFNDRVKEIQKLDPNNPAYKELDRLRGLAASNEIDAGEFDRKTGRVMTSLESGLAARAGAAGTVKSTRDQIGQSVMGNFERNLDGTDSREAKEAADALLRMVNGPLAAAQNKFNKDLEKLQKEFLDTDMSTDEFNRKLDELKNGLDVAADRAQKAAEAIQRQAILNGDFSGLNFQKAFNDRLFSFQMGRWNSMVDWWFNEWMGLGHAADALAGGFGKLNDGFNSFVTNGANWLNHAGGGFVNDISGGLAALNSKQGQIALLNNQIATLAQVLQLTNVTMSRKMEVQGQIDQLRTQLSNLLRSPPPMFTGYGRDPIFRDPGLIAVNAANGGGVNQGAGGVAANSHGGVHTVVNFPNVNKFTSADASAIYDMLDREARRRGTRLGGIS